MGKQFLSLTLIWAMILSSCQANQNKLSASNASTGASKTAAASNTVANPSTNTAQSAQFLSLATQTQNLLKSYQATATANFPQQTLSQEPTATLLQAAAGCQNMDPQDLAFWMQQYAIPPTSSSTQAQGLALAGNSNCPNSDAFAGWLNCSPSGYEIGAGVTGIFAVILWGVTITKAWENKEGRSRGLINLWQDRANFLAMPEADRKAYLEKQLGLVKERVQSLKLDRSYASSINYADGSVEPDPTGKNKLSNAYQEQQTRDKFLNRMNNKENPEDAQKAVRDYAIWETENLNARISKKTGATLKSGLAAAGLSVAAGFLAKKAAGSSLVDTPGSNAASGQPTATIEQLNAYVLTLLDNYSATAVGLASSPSK